MKTISPLVRPRPLVSIVSITYNQEKYIAQALDSFLMQKHSDFDIEIVIADDASTDGTQSIIRDYQEKHTNIHAILRRENLGIQKNLNDAMRHATGKYIALCEGDDYWIDAEKLQKQVSFLEKNIKYALCFHPVQILQEDEGAFGEIYPNFQDGFSLNNLLKTNFIQTNSVMYRRQDYKELPEDILPLDWYYHVFHAAHGEIGFINQTMAVYRRHKGGVWWQDPHKVADFWRRNAMGHVRLFECMEKLFPGEETYIKSIHLSATELISRICNQVGKTGGYVIATEIVAGFPRYAAITLTQNASEGSQPERLIKEANMKIKKLQEENQQQSAALQEAKAELEAMKVSKSWKLTKPLRVVHTRLKH